MENRHGTVSRTGHTLYYAGMTDPGRIRTVNEDNFIILPEYGLYIVADGMGGHEAGDVASRTTIKSAEQYMAYISNPAEATFPDGLSSEMLREPPLRGIVHFANMRIHRQAAGRVMGTTLVAAHFSDDGLMIANVGDSRAYLWREQELTLLTEDHSFVYELFKAGEITREEMRTHPQRNVITRAIGTSDEVEPNLYKINIVSGDMLLLCSDGLTSMATDEEIARTIRLEQDIAGLGNSLVALANQAGGRDNITVVLILIR